MEHKRNHKHKVATWYLPLIECTLYLSTKKNSTINDLSNRFCQKLAEMFFVILSTNSEKVIPPTVKKLFQNNISKNTLQKIIFVVCWQIWICLLVVDSSTIGCRAN